MSQRVVPKDKCHHATGQRAVNLNKDEVASPDQALRDDLDQHERKEQDRRPPHRVRTDLNAWKLSAKYTALAPIVRPKNAGGQRKQFAQPKTCSPFQRRPEKDEDSGKRNDGSSVPLHGSPVSFGPSLPKQRPDRRRAQVKCHVRRWSETKRTVERREVDRQAQATPPPKRTL